MNLTAILANCYERLGYGASPATAVVTRLTDFANETHRDLLSLPGMESLRDDLITAASVANQAIIGLPLSVARIKVVTDHTNMIQLREIPLSEIRRRDPGLTATGNPWAFAKTGLQAVLMQPLAATGVWAASTSAGDTTQTANVTAIRTGGYRHTASVTLTGTSRVQIGAQTDYIDISAFYLSATGAGDITLYDAVTSGNTLAVIPKGQTYSRQIGIHWYPVPATAITYFIDYTRTVPDLTTTDEPLLPQDFHDVIGLGVRMKEYETKGDPRYGQVSGEYAARVNALRSFVQTDGALILSTRRKPQKWAMLGGWYPADAINWGGW